ncbi:liver-expressed antimicrobial peptide 2-like [Scyliorhinus canicula]|uniref:liver-expressed antimicrobial peptide 2-like n=1 Tax=Scyliorhinus canicula TaxID=7830 RepID=UPI0018F48399|nr:liver-expressed antimicrobial peptide 2-like [Scyliorhinus canicula]
MRAPLNKALATTGILILVCSITVQLSPVFDNQRPLVQRIKRSLFWRWITQRPIGAICRVNSECSTNYCEIQETTALCSFQTFPA